MKKAILALLCVFGLSSVAQAQMPPLVMVPGGINAVLAAQAGQAKIDASFKVSMAWSMKAGVIMIRNNFPDHWTFFNTNILLNTNIPNSKVVAGLQMCNDIDTLLQQVDAALPPAHANTQSAVTNWYRGDRELTNFQFAQAKIWFDLSGSQADSATDVYDGAYEKLMDAEDLYLELTLIVPPKPLFPGM